MTDSDGTEGQMYGIVLWILSCLCAFCFLSMYDGCCKRDSCVISKLYSMFLLCQVISFIIHIIALSIHEQYPQVLSICFFIFQTFAGCVFLILGIIVIGVPLKYANTEKLIKYGVPLLVLSLFVLLAMVPKLVSFLWFCFYFFCVISSNVAVCLLFYWFKTKRYIFKPYYDSNNDQILKQLSRMFTISIIPLIMGQISFLYPPLTYIGMVPIAYSILWTRICDSVLVVPLILPLIRFLNKMECFQLPNIRKPAYPIRINQYQMDHQNQQAIQKQ